MNGKPTVELFSQLVRSLVSVANWGPIQKSMCRFAPGLHPDGTELSVLYSGEMMHAYSSPHSMHESSMMKYFCTSGL
jgi:hypothetical protein